MSPARILVAGIGNIFLGDDAFGVEVTRQLLPQPWPADVRIVDFGIRSFDLACALEDGYTEVILVDALSRGGAPGSLYVIEPDLQSSVLEEDSPVVAGHGLNTDIVLQWLSASSKPIPRIRIVGCEPATFGSEDDPQMGLSAEVERALRPAIELIQMLIKELFAEPQPRLLETHEIRESI